MQNVGGAIDNSSTEGCTLLCMHVYMYKWLIENSTMRVYPNRSVFKVATAQMRPWTFVIAGLCAGLSALPFLSHANHEPTFTNTWAVRIPGGNTDSAYRIARKHGLESKGLVRFFTIFL